MEITVTGVVRSVLKSMRSHGKKCVVREKGRDFLLVFPEMVDSKAVGEGCKVSVVVDIESEELLATLDVVTVARIASVEAPKLGKARVSTVEKPKPNKEKEKKEKE